MPRPNQVAKNKTVRLGGRNFAKEVLAAEIPVLVDCWAPWCFPCHVIAVAVERIAADYRGRLKVGKLNVDQNSEIASMLDVTSIPSLLVFKGGRLVDRLVGAAPLPRIVEMLRRHVPPDVPGGPSPAA